VPDRAQEGCSGDGVSPVGSSARVAPARMLRKVRAPRAGSPGSADVSRGHLAKGDEESLRLRGCARRGIFTDYVGRKNTQARDALQCPLTAHVAPPRPLLLRLVRHLPSDRCRAPVNRFARAGVGQPLTEVELFSREVWGKTTGYASGARPNHYIAELGSMAIGELRFEGQASLEPPGKPSEERRRQADRAGAGSRGFPLPRTPSARNRSAIAISSLSSYLRSPGGCRDQTSITGKACGR